MPSPVAPQHQPAVDTADPPVQDPRVQAVYDNFARMGEPGSCRRCDGRGSRDDLKFWRVAKSRKFGIVGLVCFRCDGDGREPVREMKVPPERVRRAVIYRFTDWVQNNPTLARDRATHALENGNYDPYFPILEDVYYRVLQAVPASEERTR